MEKILSFHAESVSVDLGEEAQALHFEGPSSSFGFMNEDGTRFRMSWQGDELGRGADEVVISFSSVIVERGRFRATFRRSGRAARGRRALDGVDIRFEDQTADATADVLAALRVLLRRQHDVLRIAIAGLPERLPDDSA